jgi:hypothetical protein
MPRKRHPQGQCPQSLYSSFLFTISKNIRLRGIHLRAVRAKTVQLSKAGPGGGERDRTDDLRLAKPALSQLSYTPSGIDTRQKRWWAWVDSNYRPHAYQACALTT